MLLLRRGFNVKKVYLDAVSAGDKAAFEYLQRKFPDLELSPTVHAGMRFANRANSASADGAQGGKAQKKVLAIGQKAAYFENTNYFVNVVEGGGMVGYEAVYKTARLMREAFEEEKDMESLVGVKGLGCESGCAC